MSLRQQTLTQSLVPATNEVRKAPQTRTRGGAKKEIELATPITEFVKGKETRKKKLNGKNSKIDDYYDIHGNDKTFISHDIDNEKDHNQSSISTASTNTTIDYERINHLKSIKLASDFSQIPSGNTITIGGNSNIMQVEDKPLQIDIQANQKPAIDFKQFLDEQQKQKLKKEEELEQQKQQQQQKNAKLLQNFENLKKKSALSNSTTDLISKILNKNKTQQDKPDNIQNFNNLSSAKKIDLIEEKLLSTLKMNSSVEKDSSKIMDAADQIQKLNQKVEQSNKMIDEKEEIFELQTQKLNQVDSEIEITKQEDKAESKFEQILQTVQNNEKAQKILAGPSIKQRYEDLLKGDQQEFALPYKYKVLLETFSKFDECIQFFKDRNKPTLFKDLKFNLEQTMRATISLKQIQQIIHLYPQAYQLKWVQNKQAHEQLDLLVNSACDENDNRVVLTKADRLQKLRNLLVEKVKYFHNLYLKSQAREHLEQELLDNFRWHDDFKLQDVPNLEEQALPLKPFEIKVEPLKETLEKNQVKNDILARLMKSKAEEQEEKEKQRKELIEKSLYISTKENKTGLSDRLYQLIKAKEEKINEEKLRQSLSKGTEMQRRIPEIKKVVEIIMVYYIQRKVSNMFYASIVDYLTQSSNIIISKSSAIEMIDYLIQNCPFWITLIPNKQGSIIRIDKSVALSKILAEIEKIES
ncbi:DNA replication factor Cdt1 (macronuclear) [Tetrahymena thermophila SB210]|uniref:DNA replication factor Cdt1 n=1 Tax=Tetrahymena thermophila (strain SB210) TaxID=312017 RepID=I7MK88_TETTS|nr:DNA replication factor Cdt1 [Tetrahymena thermophila SB210]EAR97866.1 DNA replication factor Cdt1 [Tetrahymena thermophila SB210]|eukprot:XP_001018111.1 DNA replication factor Cdt1 [Tetrahymena thermophila SB210]